MSNKRATHTLKTWPQYYKDVVSGKKNFDVRKNDRAFKVNDLLILREYDPVTEKHTGCDFMVRITYILTGGQFGIENGYCVLGIQ